MVFVRFLGCGKNKLGATDTRTPGVVVVKHGWKKLLVYSLASLSFIRLHCSPRRPLDQAQECATRCVDMRLDR